MTRLGSRLGAVFLAMIIALTFGCTGKTDEALEDTVEQSYDFPPGGELSVRNGDGSIWIYGSNDPGIKMIAVKSAYSTERLKQIEIKVSAEHGSVAIDTVFPNKEKWGMSDRSGTVDYTIIVPDSIRIKTLELVNGEISVEGLRGYAKARLTNGRMFARDCFCDLDLGVTRGALVLTYGWWEPRAFAVDAAIAHGNAKAFLPRGSSFHADAATTSGRILDNFSEDRARHDKGKKFDAAIGSDPSPVFRLRDDTGDIYFEKAY